MTHVAGFERDQLLLLTEAVDDYVEADNPVRFIDAIVDGRDLAAAGFARVQAKAIWRPGYAPDDLLKLHIYGRLNRVTAKIAARWRSAVIPPALQPCAYRHRSARGST